MKVPFGRPIIEDEEKKVIQEVLENPILVHGPKAVGFEEDFKKFDRSRERLE